MSATDAAIKMKIFQSGMRPSGLAKQPILIIPNEEMDDIMSYKEIY